MSLGGETWLGLSNETFYVGDQSDPKREMDPANPIGLLPCLDRPRDAVLAEITERELYLSLPSGSLAERVPLGAIPQAAIATRIAYWVQLALDWLSDMPTADVDSSLLEEPIHATWATQRARHRARRLIRRDAP